MKVIMIYEANDGSRFAKKDDCEKYEVLCENTEKAMSILKERPDSLDYGGSTDFIQQTEEGVDCALKKFCELCAQRIPSYAEWFKQTADGTRHHSHIGRIISDYDIKCLGKAYYRFSCISDTYKEYSQPYYAANETSKIEKD